MTDTSLTVRDARPDEAGLLSALALRSKALWPYSAQFIEACRDELTYTAAQLAHPEMVFRVAAQGDVVAAFCALDLRPAGDGELLALFVDPEHVRRGLGERLWRDAVATARQRDVAALAIASDPYAEPFYAKMGARKIGEIPSHSIPGRVLPQMRFVVSPSTPAAS